VKSIKVTVSDEKKRSPVFQEKIEVTPSVAIPGDTHPSDATAVEHVVRSPWALKLSWQHSCVNSS